MGRRKSQFYYWAWEGLTKNKCILCHLEKPCSWPVFLWGKCNWRCLSSDASKLAKRWAYWKRTWRFHLLTGQCSILLEAHCPGLSQWQSAKEIDRACWWWRQCDVKMASTFTWPGFLRFFSGDMWRAWFMSTLFLQM